MAIEPRWGLFRLACILLTLSATAACDRTPPAPARNPSESSVPCPPGMALVPAGTLDSAWKEPGPVSEWMKGRMYYRIAPSGERAVGAVCMDLYEYPNDPDQPPKADVTFHEARAACRAVGKDLCTEDQWELACVGPNRWSYAYGPEKDPARCNTQARSGDWESFKPSNRFPNCVSPLGIHDLNGNVSEWVLASGIHVDGEEIVRGGTTWNADYGQSCDSRHSHQADTRWSDDGFRCCAPPADATGPGG